MQCRRGLFASLWVFCAASHHVREVAHTVAEKHDSTVVSVDIAWCTAHVHACSTRKNAGLTAFSSRFFPDMQAASCKIILSHTIIITLWVSARGFFSLPFFRIGPK